MRTKGINILLIEDNPGDIELTKRALAKCKHMHAIGVVRDGIAALDYLERSSRFPARSPDLILLDLNLPLRNGLELLTQLKSDPELRKIPVVVLTTSAKESDIERAYDLQASGYIVKPLDLRRFVEILQAIESYWVDIVQLPPAQNAPLRIMRPQ